MGSTASTAAGSLGIRHLLSAHEDHDREEFVTVRHPYIEPMSPHDDEVVSTNSLPAFFTTSENLLRNGPPMNRLHKVVVTNSPSSVFSTAGN